MIGVAAALMLVLGTLCVGHAALTLVHGDARWGWPGYLCLALFSVLALLRLQRTGRTPASSLQWDADRACFLVSSRPGQYHLAQVWRGPYWVTLGLSTPASPRPLYLVVWKSSMSPGYWSQLAMRIQAGSGRFQRPENKENP